MTTPPSQIQGEMPEEIYLLSHPTMGDLVARYPVGDAAKFIRADLAESRGSNTDALEALKAMVSFYDGKKDENGVVWNSVAMAWAKEVISKSWRPTHRHVKRGTDYMVIGPARIQTTNGLHDDEAAIVYQDKDGVMWCRSYGEFNDGRFVPLPPSERNE